MTNIPALEPYKPTFTWVEMVLSDTWGLHAKAFRAEYYGMPPDSDLPATGSAAVRGCYHALVLAPDPLRNRPMYQLQIEGYTYAWNDGVRQNVPDSERPPISVMLDAKMQLVPADIVIGVLVEHAFMNVLPVHILQGMQVGASGSALDRMGGKLPSLLHKA